MRIIGKEGEPGDVANSGLQGHRKTPAVLSLRQASCFSAGIGDELIIVFVPVEAQITYNWLPNSSQVTSG
jgi:hypothetical protein